MIVRALDIDGDWEFGKGTSDYLSGQAALSQMIRTNVSSFLGDCFFELAFGIDWFTFLGGGKDPLALTLSIASIILNTEGVTGVLQISSNLNRNSRGFSVTYQVTTVYSVLTNSFNLDLAG